MGQIGISIVKRCVMRDSTQEFSNTYHYGSIDVNPSAAVATALINEVVAQEKVFHSTGVTFMRGLCWSSGGTIQQNQMIVEVPLTGTGASGTFPGFDVERAVLIKWGAGIDSLGRPVFLKKWYHCCGNFNAVGMTNSLLQNATGFSQANRDSMAADADVLTRIGGANQWGLVAESGRTRSGGVLGGDPPTAHKYLEHHQLGDMWRG